MAALAGAGRPASRDAGLVAGLTGHRWNRIPGVEAAALRAALRDLFDEITQAADGRRCTLVTGMAEGADLTATTALPEGWTLHALLPLPADAWRAHLARNATGDPADAVRLLDVALSRPGTTAEPCPPVDDGRPDYAGLGRALVEKCDVLIAVWDGSPGKPGGTGNVVEMSRKAGKPVIRLWRNDAGHWHITP